MNLLECEFHGLERVFDPSVVNTVSNHPSIFPSIAGGREGPLDWTRFVEDRRHVFLAGDFGLSIFEFVEDGVYEMHMRVLPQGRGKWSIGFALASVAWMFRHPWVMTLVCRSPRGNYASHALVRRCCGKFECTLHNGWVDEVGCAIEADIYSMTRERWTRLNANA
jgi:hypothetical protein